MKLHDQHAGDDFPEPHMTPERHERHDPKSSRQALVMVLIVFGPWVLCALAVWAIRSWIGG